MLTIFFTTISSRSDDGDDGDVEGDDINDGDFDGDGGDGDGGDDGEGDVSVASSRAATIVYSPSPSSSSLDHTPDWMLPSGKQNCPPPITYVTAASEVVGKYAHIYT